MERLNQVLELFFYQGDNKDKNKEKNYILKDTLLITSAETILTNCKTEIVLASIFIFIVTFCYSLELTDGRLREFSLNHICHLYINKRQMSPNSQHNSNSNKYTPSRVETNLNIESEIHCCNNNLMKFTRRCSNYYFFLFRNSNYYSFLTKTTRKTN